MGRPVENDDFCKFKECSDFDVEEDECLLDKCKYSPKRLKHFEYMEALD